MLITAHLRKSKKKSIILSVINLTRDFCLKLREARRKNGVSQSSLASEVGCKQSALSMFEQGDGTKLNDEVIKKIAQKFSIKMEEEEGEIKEAPQNGVLESDKRGYCPNPECPSNHRYNVGSETFAKIDRAMCDPVYGKYCVVCGEILEHKCPNCGAHLHEGAVCTYCGHKYVAL